MVRWPTCCVPGCGQPSQAVYRRRVRGPNGALQSQKTRGFCGAHDSVFTRMLGQLFELIELKHPEAGGGEHD
jgi:hypothetical protein